MNDKKSFEGGGAAWIVIAAVIAMVLLCAMVLPFIGRIPAWFLGGW